MLSHLFQNKVVDITTIGSMVKIDIAQICILFIEENTDLNCEIFNEQTGYHILPEFGPQGRYLRRFPNEIRGGKFHDVDMIRDRTEQDLIKAMTFQKQFALAVCNALECRFEDNHIMAAFKVLGLTNMPSKQVGLANWGWLNWS